jgi:TonB-dependent starch-binding outer membrane protein SusC
MKIKSTTRNSSVPYMLLKAILIVLFPVFGIAQNVKLIRGSVSDPDGLPQANVSITVKGTNKGTFTTTEGKFSIKASPADILVFSIVGFKIQEILVGTRTSLDVSMEPTVSKLGEVVVIGYGSVKKKDLTGSVAQVNITDLTKAPIASFTEALAGRVSGVRVSSSDGQPGVSQDIVIRGISSLTQSTAPLYVIDGFPVENLASAAINPNDIESISVLKDASATAIYGARGANGVIVIETKKGKVGKPVITFNSSYGIQKLMKKMEMMNSYDFVKYVDEAFTRKGAQALAASQYYINGKTLDSYKTIPAIDWQDLIFRTGKIKINDIAIRGGNLQTRYSVSGSIYNQDGIMLNTSYDRYQGRASLDQIISNKLKIGITVNYGSIATSGALVANGTTNQVSYLLWQTLAYRPVVGTNVDLASQIVDAEAINVNDTRFNPVSTINNQYTKNKTGDLLSQAYLTYDISSKLSLKVTGTENIRGTRADNFFNSNTQDGSPLNPRNTKGVNGSILNTEINTWSNENTLTYNNIFRKRHTLNVLGGFSMQKVSVSVSGFAAQNIPNEQLGISGLDEGLPYLGFASESNNTLVSFFGRLNYNYDSKYYLTGTFRGDGTSKFAKGKKWGYFPSGAFAWNMSRENFMHGLKVISNAKLRVSYGITGNNRVSDFPYIASLALPIGASYSFNNAVPSPGIIPNSLANADLKWESTEQADIGYDLGLFNNRIELTVDVYRKTTKDLLLNASLPSSTGFASVFKNVGTLRNEGLEFNLNTINVKTKSFSWASNFNISFNRNKIIALAQNQETLFAGTFIANNPWVSQIGQPAGMFYGYVFDGVYQYADFDNPSPGVYILRKDRPDNGVARTLIQPGDQKFKDINGDGTINTFDNVVIGRSQPIHTGGFSNNFSYKGFDLNVFCQWSYGNQLLNADRYMFEGNGNNMNNLNQYAVYADRWSPTNPSNTMYKAGGQGPLSTFSSRLIEDGSYLRLKTVSLGYSVPPALIKRLYLTQLRFHVSGQNLLTWTNYSGRDPEVSVRNTILTPGLDFSAYPQARSITFGLNATF